MPKYTIQEQAAMNIAGMFVRVGSPVHDEYIGLDEHVRCLKIAADRPCPEIDEIVRCSPIPVVVEIRPMCSVEILRVGDGSALADCGCKGDGYEAQWTCCHNPPIPGGVQIQPERAGWVGTGGVAFSWVRDGVRKYGVLTNWHVAAAGDERVGRTIHQPSTSLPAIGVLDAWTHVRPGMDLKTDAAVVDCRWPDNGGHWDYFGREVLGANAEVARQHVDFEPGDVVVKSGRSTYFKQGTCIGTGGTVRVNMGSFVATFVDQDRFGGGISAPGDSGSQIYLKDGLQPGSLLFAGGGGITIGSPARHVVAEFNGTWDF